MSEPQKCPRCGAVLPAGGLQGLCPACLLQQGATAESISHPSVPFTPPSMEELAKLFPQFEIISLLGKGGMGAVYKARQASLDRFVALKILAPQTEGGPSFTERFNREARALARLSHPTIVAVHEFGEAGGMHYFIMEYVDGVNLRQLEKAGQLSPREALQIVPQICDALQYAHDEGVVHRDIKPENILIDRKGRVKIADFGLAIILGLDGEALRLTGEGHVMGTPHYMAPEQVEHPLEVDHRADIYSLGVVFYEMLTGELPLGKFAPPSERARGVRVDVRLDEVVLRALAKEPELRYQQVSEVKSGVQNIGEPLIAGKERSQFGLVAVWIAIFLPFFLTLLASRGNSAVLWSVTSVSFLLAAAAILLNAKSVRSPAKAGASGQRRPLSPFMLLVVSAAAVVVMLVILLFISLAVPAYQKVKARRIEPRHIDAPVNLLPLTEGSIRLVAVSEHPSKGKLWWKPDGAPFAEESFETTGANVYPQPAEMAREFVFHSQGLPADASSLNWEIDSASGWAGNLQAMQNGKLVPGDEGIAACLPKTEHTTTVRAGAAYGPWETVSENEGTVMSSKFLGHGASVGSIAFMPPIEKKNGGIAVAVSYTVSPPMEEEVRLVVVDKDGREHAGNDDGNSISNGPVSANGVQSSGGLTHLSIVVPELSADQAKRLCLQVRPYHWVTFKNVALQPDTRAAAGKAVNK